MHMKKLKKHFYNLCYRASHESRITSHVSVVNRATRDSQRGGMLVELLLAVALALAMIPFLIRAQSDRARRAENVAAARDIGIARAALEKYMDENKQKLMVTISRSVVRVAAADLVDYGLPPDFATDRGENIQMRILKSQTNDGHSTLQGIVVISGSDMNPLRTREIAQIAGSGVGFIAGNEIGGGFGTYRARIGDFGGGLNEGLVEGTTVMQSGDEYLWRAPSNDPGDATMQSGLSIGGHDVKNIGALDSRYGKFDENIDADSINITRAIFSTRSLLDGELSVSGEAQVVGSLSGDARNMDVSGLLLLQDTARFSAVNATDLFAGDLNLSGLTVGSPTVNQIATLNVGRLIDMVGGRLTAVAVNIGYSGSITPRLTVSTKISDASDPGYFWDLTQNRARFSDMQISALNQMMQAVVAAEGSGTESYKSMSTVAGNPNATVADFERALSDIQKRVRAKYNLLNLE